jgi:hypothetical protein
LLLTFLLTFVHHVAHPQDVSHSPSIAIAYLVRNYTMSYDGALAFVEWEQSWRRPQTQRRFTS